MISTKLFKGYTPIERSRKTCYNCRVKRKKCDMKKPTCTRCLKSKSNKECIWPENGESVMSKKLVEQINPKFRIIQFDSNKLVKSTDCEMKSISSFTSSPEFDNSASSVSSSIGCQEDIMTQNEEEAKVQIASFTGGQQIISTISLFPVQSLSMDHPVFLACVPEFMISTSPQYTDPSLTVPGLCGKYYDTNDIARTVSMAGGCQYLSWKYLELSPIALQSYERAKKKLYQFIDQKGISLFLTKEDNWVLSSALYLLVTALLKHSVNKSSVVNNILLIYQLVKQKLTMNSFFEDSSISILQQEEQKVLIIQNEADSTTIEGLKFNKFMSESFIYHYGTTILVTNDFRKLPNPDQLFNDFSEILNTHIIDSEVSWMNNPILGASFKSFKIYCKSSYLFRIFIDMDTIEACDMLTNHADLLIEEVKNHRVEDIPHKVRNRDPKIFCKLKNSVLASNIFLASSMVLLRNIEDSFVDEFDKEIQRAVQQALSSLKRMTPLAFNKTIIGFPLFIIGCCCISENDRRLVLRELNEIAEITHGYRVFTMVKALNISWGVYDGGSKQRGLGMRTLRSKDILESIN